jgi:hypothetical protein
VRLMILQLEPNYATGQQPLFQTEADPAANQPGRVGDSCPAVSQLLFTCHERQRFNCRELEAASLMPSRCWGKTHWRPLRRNPAVARSTRLDAATFAVVPFIGSDSAQSFRHVRPCKVMLRLDLERGGGHVQAYIDGDKEPAVGPGSKFSRPSGSQSARAAIDDNGGPCCRPNGSRGGYASMRVRWTRADAVNRT